MKKASHEPRGLTQAEAEKRQIQYGKNLFYEIRKNHFLESLVHIVREPMFVLLTIACILYFTLGDLPEAVMMLVSIVFVAGIELFQETKSGQALDALRAFTSPRALVLRDGVWQELPTEEIVPGDVVNLGEGERIPADGQLLQSHDLSVDESILTGESLAIEKSPVPENRLVFQGTTVSSGQGIFEVTSTGFRTELGKLGKTIESIEPAPTPLQNQIETFVRQMAWLGGIAFLVVLALNFSREHDFWQALLFSLTVAMALIPEEIPVAFTTFMALGSYRMIKLGILAKQPKTVESLGSATVICLDKTGTITENNMAVAEVISFPGQNADGELRVLHSAWWASEPEPMDAMERALQIKLVTSEAADIRQGFHMIHEYPLGGSPPMMTHVWGNSHGRRIIAAKGALERILEVCSITGDFRRDILEQAELKAEKGYRILGVASADASKYRNYPEHQDDFDWQFEGIVAFYDPPKENAAEVFQQFDRAGIRAVMITGDHAATAKNIARAVGLKGWELALTGREVMDLEEGALRDAVTRVNVFARMFPEAKLRVVNALAANGETVAMTGDGVNDGPALKSAQIGVAMGQRGTELARSAASLVLLRDNLADMAVAVEMGRRIYDNLRKAIRYIISIHLPIILVVLLPLLLGWPYPHILLPLHVIFLELVMDPMAAVGFENEPAEPNLMRKPPRKKNAALFSGKELTLSLLQGTAIGLAVMMVFRMALQQGMPEDGIRAMVFSTLVFSNLFLVLSNRSFDDPLTKSLFYKNPQLWKILGISLLMLSGVLYWPFVAGIFRVLPLSLTDLGTCALAGLASIAWFELYKLLRTGVKPSRASETALVVISGLPGTGKSTVAAAFSRISGALRLNSDLLRQELHQTGQYSEANKSGIYRLMFERARAALAAGKSVCLDATFYREDLRDEVRRLAADMAVKLCWVELQANEAVVQTRVSKPRPDSEADFTIYRKIKEKYKPLDFPHLSLLNNDATPDALATEIIQYLQHISSGS